MTPTMTSTPESDENMEPVSEEELEKLFLALA
jgi:hypothetical protein